MKRITDKQIFMNKFTDSQLFHTEIKAFKESTPKFHNDNPLFSLDIPTLKRLINTVSEPTFAKITENFNT